MTSTLVRVAAGHCAGPECGVVLVYGAHRHRKGRTIPAGHRAHAGRGLCTTCYSAVERDGRLGDYRRSTVPREQLLDDWSELRELGLGRRRAAVELGLSLAAFERALYRAAEREDPRAVLGHR